MQFLPRGVEHFAPLHLGQGVRRQPEGKKGREEGRVGEGGVIESEIEAHVQSPRRINSLRTMYNSSYAAFRVVSHRVQPVVRWFVWVGLCCCLCFASRSMYLPLMSNGACAAQYRCFQGLQAFRRQQWRLARGLTWTLRAIGEGKAGGLFSTKVGVCEGE